MTALDDEEVAAVCAGLLGVKVTGLERISGGRNSQVFRLEGGRTGEPCRYVVKQYFAAPEDSRDRLGTEYRALQLLRARGVENVPQPIAMDVGSRCAVYSFEPGGRASLGGVGARDISQALGLLAALERIARAGGVDGVGPASEACFSIDAIADNVAGRLGRLRALQGGADGGGDLHRFIDERVDPFISSLDAWTGDEAKRAGISRHADIALAARTLSPSDFGFHNALRDESGRLVFVDFEYFGWDDPAKTIVDFLHHPAMDMADGLRRDFVAGALDVFRDVDRLAARAKIVYPWFGLKWCLILLNEFVPEHLSRRRFAGVADGERSALLARQLDRARTLLASVDAAYRDNAFFD